MKLALRLALVALMISSLFGVYQLAQAAGALPGANESRTIAGLPRTVRENASPSKLLRKIPVRPEQPRSGYDRDLFPHWIDADQDGCDTRREVIRQESLEPVQVTGECRIDNGAWVSVYDGAASRGYPSDFDVDHVVALAEAWDSGADAWSIDLREQFANDLDFRASLIAVSASSNRAKSDKDPSQWLPTSPEAHCGFAADWVRVKYRWGLTVDRAEKRTLKRVLKGCSDSSSLVRAAN